MKRRISIIATIVLVVATMIAPRGASEVTKSASGRNLDIFNALYRTLGATYVDSVDGEAAIKRAIGAMLSGIDPYTEYISEKDLEAFETVSSGEYGGIGAYLREKKDGVYIEEAMEGSPAAKAGLLSGDRIWAINGDTLVGNESDNVSSLLKGQPGTHVSITVHRPWVGADSVKTFDLVRGNISVDEVPYYGVYDGHIGYVALTTFNEHSGQSVRDAVLALKENPAVDALVLDLRGNGGGLLNEAVKIVSLFVPKGTEVLRYRGRDVDNERIYKTTTKPIDDKIPLVVLVDGGTASAAEIVSGALQDLDRAVIVGKRSFGKGLVQSSYPLPYNGLLKVTIAKYYIPSGRLIQALDYKNRNADGTPGHTPDSLANTFYTKAGRPVRDGGGITPDIVVKYPESDVVTYTAVTDGWIFDFANKYHAEHPTIPEPEEFTITDSIFNEFKAFINPDKFRYDVRSETTLKMLREIVELEGYLTDSVSAQLDALTATLKHNLNRDLDINRENLIFYLEPEILRRYYYNRGETVSNLKRDVAMDSVKKLFATPGEYKKLLSAPAKQKKH